MSEMILEKKYVFHIPLYEFLDEKLIKIDIKDVLDELLCKLSEESFENLYITKAKGVYKKRCFDELLITLFASQNTSKTPDEIFKEWFYKNNYILNQEAFAWECDGRMHIETLKR